MHAKVIVVTSERGAAAFRSSMNLNKNLRTEQFDIDVCPDVAEFYRGWFDALWDEAGRSQDNRAIIAAVYDRFRAGPASEAPMERPGRKLRIKGRQHNLAEASFSAADRDGLL